MKTLLTKENYHHYFESLSKFVKDELIEIKVSGLELGDQVEADYVALRGITYETKSDKLFLYLSDELEHVVNNPVEVNVIESELGIDEIAVKCSHGHLHLIKFKHAMPLKV